ncbi:MAG: efflux RND transporter permease subunit [Mesorhizobium sp.]|nr:hypothetical protein [Mesorhizobium sp.]MCO5164031.1 efflux RND transporter permease subunit [Mesorhizobium sp.]
MPEINGDVLEARILLPQGTRLAETERAVDQVTAALKHDNRELVPRQPEGLPS